MKYATTTYNNVSLLEVNNEKGLKVVFAPVGASIKSIIFDGQEMLVAPEKNIDFFSSNFLYGKTVNPLEKSKVILNNIEYSLNRSYSLPYFLYKSNPNLSKKVFSIFYSFEKKKGKDGLPNNVKYYVSYSLSEASNEMLIDYRATSDMDYELSLSNNLIFSLSSKERSELILNIPYKQKINDKSFVADGQPILIENEKYILKYTPIDYECIEIATLDNLNIDGQNKGISVLPFDNPNKENITKKGMLYHRQILLEFIKK